MPLHKSPEYGDVQLECHYSPSDHVFTDAWGLDTDLGNELELANSSQVRPRRVSRPELPGACGTPAAFGIFTIGIPPSAGRKNGRFAGGDVRFGNGEAQCVHFLTGRHPGRAVAGFSGTRAAGGGIPRES
jgi:hypothetical protein